MLNLGPHISFITATIGRDSLVDTVASVNKAIEDAKFSKWCGVEHLICGDGKDPTEVIPEELDRDHQRVYRMPAYGHEAHVRNDAVKLATGTYVAFIDDDDMISGDYIDQIWLDTYKLALAPDVLILPQTLPITGPHNEPLPGDPYHIIPKRNLGSQIVWGNVGISYCYKRNLHIPFVPSRHEDLLHLVAMESRHGARVQFRYSDKVGYFGRGAGYVDR